MQKKVKQYNSEEKTKVVLEAIKGELTMAQISSKYGVHSTQIVRWKKDAIESMILGFKAKTKTKEINQDDLVRNLYEQIGQLTVERDWMKKKSNLFSSGS